MKSGRHLDWWVSGLLVVVCLLLARNFASEIKSHVLPLYSRVDSTAHSAPTRKSSAGPSRERGKSGDISSSHPSSVLGLNSKVAPPPRRHSLESASTLGAAAAGTVEPTTPLQATNQAPPQPATSVLKPLGYIEDANGRAEAVIAEGNGVRIVHEGEAIGEHSRIVKITPSSVEIAEVIPPPESPSNSTMAAALPTQKPTASVSLGYVERTSGQREAIVAEGDSVQLMQEASTVAATQTATVSTPTNVGMASAPGNQVFRADGPQKLTLREALPKLPRQPLQLAVQKAVIPPPTPTVSLKPQVGVKGPDLPLRLARAGSREQMDAPLLRSPLTGQANEAETKMIGYVEKSSGEVDTIIAERGEVKLVPEAWSRNSIPQTEGDQGPPETVAELPSDPAVPPRRTWPERKPDREPHPWLALESPGASIPWPALPAPVRLEEWTSGSDPPRSPPLGWQGSPLAGYWSGPYATGPPGEPRPPNLEGQILTEVPTLGYVQEPDGQVYAILPDEENVRLVRRGEALGEGIRVAGVYQSSIAVAHPPELDVTPFLSPDLYSRGKFASGEELGNLDTRGPRRRTSLGRKLKPSGTNPVEQAEARRVRLLDQPDVGCTDRGPGILDEAAGTPAESPEYLENTVGGQPGPAALEANNGPGVEDDQDAGLNPDAVKGTPPLAATSQDSFQRPPPGILPLEDFDATPKRVAAGEGEVRLVNPPPPTVTLEWNRSALGSEPAGTRTQNPCLKRAVLHH